MIRRGGVQGRSIERPAQNAPVAVIPGVEGITNRAFN
jgi:hypothetical protein